MAGAAFKGVKAALLRGDPEQVERVIGALEAIAYGGTKEKRLTIKCPKCKAQHGVSVQIDDLNAQTRALQLLLEFRVGKAPTGAPPVEAARPAQELGSTERRELIASLREQIKEGGI